MTAAVDTKSMIENLIANRAQQLAESQAAQEAIKAAEAQRAREARRQHIVNVLGDLWPVFEPYTAAKETIENDEYYTEIDPRPLQLARFWVQPAYNRHGSPAIEFYLALRYSARTVEPGRLDDMLLILREAYQGQQRTAAERAARAAETAREVEENRRHQQQLGAEYAAAYRAYALERSRIRKYNAGLVVDWNHAHAEPYQIKQIAYPIGANEENAGEAAVNVVTYPNGEWTDAAGYHLSLEYGGTATRRRYTTIIWEEAPRTVTPGPGISGYEQRQMRLGGFMIYARPAEEQIAQTAADLLAAMLPIPDAPTRPADLWSDDAGEIEHQAWQEIGDDAGEETDY